jgi:hypothetical protein
MPARTRAAIMKVEASDLWRGAVAEALAAYRRFLARPGRYLYLTEEDLLYAPNDPVHARDLLEIAVQRMPKRGRVGLRAILAPLDDEFLRRTLPDPQIAKSSPWHAEYWWRQRLHDPH